MINNERLWHSWALLRLSLENELMNAHGKSFLSAQGWKLITVGPRAEKNIMLHDMTCWKWSLRQGSRVTDNLTRLIEIINMNLFFFPLLRNKYEQRKKQKERNRKKETERKKQKERKNIEINKKKKTEIKILIFQAVCCSNDARLSVSWFWIWEVNQNYDSVQEQSNSELNCFAKFWSFVYYQAFPFQRKTGKKFFWLIFSFFWTYFHCFLNFPPKRTNQSEGAKERQREKRDQLVQKCS